MIIDAALTTIGILVGALALLGALLTVDGIIHRTLRTRPAWAIRAHLARRRLRRSLPSRTGH